MPSARREIVVPMYTRIASALEELRQEWQRSIIVGVAILIVGWLVFLIPVTIVAAFWLPRRIRFYRQARASQVFLDALPDLDLFALRAMAAQPLYVLAGISDDPVKAWRSGDRAVINELAELELRRNGLRLPDTLRAMSSEASIG